MINVEDKVKLDINDDEIFTITEKSITDEDRLQCQCGGCLVVKKILLHFLIHLLNI